MNRRGEAEGPAEGVPVRMSGVIVPAAWDDQGRTVRVAFASHDERELEILPEGLGREALARVRREVEIAGLIRPGPGGAVLEILEIREVGLDTPRGGGPE